MTVTSDPALVPALSDCLTSRFDLVAERVGSDRLAVSLTWRRSPTSGVQGGS